MEETTSRQFKIVSSRNGHSDVTESEHRLVQGLLFGIQQQNVLVFVSLAGVEEDDFLALLRSTKPAVVVELRPVPRFDIGRLNRQTVFECFEREQARYLDVGVGNCDLGNSQSVRSCLQPAAAVLRSAAKGRPLMFLISELQNHKQVRQTVYDLLGCAEGEWQVLEVPSEPDVRRDESVERHLSIVRSKT
jgi:hypothetical protein